MLAVAVSLITSACGAELDGHDHAYENADGRAPEVADVVDVASTSSTLIYSGYTNRSISTPNQGSRNGVRPQYIVLHHMASTSFQGVLNMWATASRVGSANYAISNEGEVVGVVPEEYRSWSLSSAAWDSRSITFEIENESAGGSWPVSTAAHEATAKVVSDLARRYGIPLDRDRVLGHREVYTRYGASYPTACPGGLNMDWIVSRARQLLVPASPPLPDDVFEAATLDAVGSSDVNGDGLADVCARAAKGIICHLSNGTGFPTVIDGPALSDASGWADPANYQTLRLADYTGDGKADLCAHADDGMMCWPSTGTGFGPGIQTGALSDANSWARPEYYSTIRMADVSGDGKADLCARGAAAFYCWLSNGAGFAASYIKGPLLSDANGWDDPDNYATLRMGDVNGDGKADVCARANDRFLCWLSNGAGFPTQVEGPSLSDGNGWDDLANWSTLRLADVNGDQKADVCARADSRFLCWLSNGAGFPTQVDGPPLSDVNGWAEHDNYSTLRLADLDGDGDRDLCARANAGLLCWLWTGAGFGPQLSTLLLSDANGWANPVHYLTLRLADVTGDKKADLCALASNGVVCWPSTGAGFGTMISGPQWTTANGWSSAPYYTTLRLGP